MKKLIPLFVFLFTLSASAKDFSYNGIVYTVLDDEALTVETKAGYETKIDNKTKLYPGNNVSDSFTIPSKVYDGNTEYTVTRIGDYAFATCYNLKNVFLPETIKEIGKYAFAECMLLDNIIIPNSVTTLGEFAFFGCMTMKSVKLSESTKIIPSACFTLCLALREINIPQIVTSIEMGAFLGCDKIEQIVIPNNVLTIGSLAFSSCSALKEVWLPESLFIIGKNIFDGSKALSSIYYPIKSFTAVGYDDSFDDNTYQNTTLFVPADMVSKCQASSPWKYFDNIREFNFSGLNITTEDDNIKTEYYNLNGVKINEPSHGEVVIERKGNKTRKIIF